MHDETKPDTPDLPSLLEPFKELRLSRTHTNSRFLLFSGKGIRVPIYTSKEDFLRHCKAGRLLGIDVGEKTFGLALSDTTRLVSTSFSTLRRKKWTPDALQLVSLIETHGIAGIIVGWPLNMNGTLGPRCQATHQFAENLLQLKDLPLLFWDERLSSKAVTQAFLEADLSRTKRQQKIDQVAAAYILQGALNYLRL